MLSKVYMIPRSKCQISLQISRSTHVKSKYDENDDPDTPQVTGMMYGRKTASSPINNYSP